MFIFLDKPTGWTSHDLVEKVRRLYYDEKVGHGGTLDPLATGLLVIAIGKETKKLSLLLGADKTYIATIDFSRLTDTRDSDSWKDDVSYAVDHEQEKICIDDEWRTFPSPEEIHTLFARMIGTHNFPLTPFSAKKVRGKKLYEYAREGNPIFLDISMEVHAVRLLDISFPQMTIEFSVGSGTYIRSLAHWLGEQWGLGGTIVLLRRTKIGNISLP